VDPTNFFIRSAIALSTIIITNYVSITTYRISDDPKTYTACYFRFFKFEHPLQYCIEKGPTSSYNTNKYILTFVCIYAIYTVIATTATTATTATSDQRTATSEQRPANSDQRTATSEQRPANGEQRPANKRISSA
jgi:hypothetical protein